MKFGHYLPVLEVTNVPAKQIPTAINLCRRYEKRFDLYYYDGLARQDEEIRLTVGEPH